MGGAGNAEPARLLGRASLVGGTEVLGKLPAERMGARGGSAGPDRLLLASERLPGGSGIA